MENPFFLVFQETSGCFFFHYNSANQVCSLKAEEAWRHRAAGTTDITIGKRYCGDVADNPDCRWEARTERVIRINITVQNPLLFQGVVIAGSYIESIKGVTDMKECQKYCQQNKEIIN